MQFDFGQNWIDFSTHAVDDRRVRAAREDFYKLVGNIPLRAKSFLDIGFGQGLSLLSACEAGAHVFGIDINTKCFHAVMENTRYFPGCPGNRLNIFQGSILEMKTVEALRRISPRNEGFDIVHSWGVLHHTGNMKRAIENAVSLVRPEGNLILAIYNRHWTSPLWRQTKWLYGKSSISFRKAMIRFFYPMIWVAKLAVTRKSPHNKDRGMDFYYDVIDWLGGYPYEYATAQEIDALVLPLGFKNTSVLPTEVPTGCNQFVYRKLKEPVSTRRPKCLTLKHYA